ncbi:MAG: rRNA maturation RNase YbeY [Planctomycetota bacterium]
MTTSDEHSDQGQDEEPPEPPADRCGTAAQGGKRHLQITLAGCPEDAQEQVRRAARYTLRRERFLRGRLDITLLGNAEMKRQHKRWLGLDSTTDVLSFDLRESPRAGFVDAQLLVCLSVARRRARNRKTDWHGELLLYVVHGCLHLCGYDDRSAEDATRMHETEDEILSTLGWGPVFLPARPRRKAQPDRRTSSARSRRVRRSRS